MLDGIQWTLNCDFCSKYYLDNNNKTQHKKRKLEAKAKLRLNWRTTPGNITIHFPLRLDIGFRIGQQAGVSATVRNELLHYSSIPSSTTKNREEPKSGLSFTRLGTSQNLLCCVLSYVTLRNVIVLLHEGIVANNITKLLTYYTAGRKLGYPWSSKTEILAWNNNNAKLLCSFHLLLWFGFSI